MNSKQLSYIYTPVDNCFHYQTVPERMQQIAEKKAKDDVYVFLYPDGRRDTISAGALFENAKALARSLVKLGIKKGDVVATCLPNDKNALICTFGIMCSGAVLTHLILLNRDGSDLQQKLNKLGIKCLILFPGLHEEQLGACMNFIDQIHPDGRVVSAKVPSLHTVIATSKAKEIEMLQFDDLIRETDNAEVTLPRLDPDEDAYIISTSGSTGEPKFVPHTHRDAMITGKQLKESIGYDENDVLYSERRMAWGAGFPVMFLHDGTKVVTLTEPIANFYENAAFTYKTLETEKCTIACISPQTVIGLLDKISSVPEYPVHILKNIHITGFVLASNCINALGNLTDEITNCYGTSEGGALASNHVTKETKYVNFCAGKPSSGVEIKIVDTDGLVAERGDTGVIHVRISCMSMFYQIDRHSKAPASMTNGWMNTEDMGYVTEDDSLVVIGRISDVEGVFYAGGKHGHRMSSYFEALIKEHHNVLDAVVVTVPDNVFGDLICACVIPLPGRNLSANDLDNFCMSQMVSSLDLWERSKLIMIFESYPKLSTGKIDKHALREEAIRRRKAAFCQ